jgi:hypothetical protein
MQQCVDSDDDVIALFFYMTAANQILGSDFYQVYIIYTNRKIISI